MEGLRFRGFRVCRDNVGRMWGDYRIKWDRLGLYRDNGKENGNYSIYNIIYSRCPGALSTWISSSSNSIGLLPPCVGFLKTRVPLWKVPIKMWIMVFQRLYWDPLILGNYHRTV